jgi:hypothetical protein
MHIEKPLPGIIRIVTSKPNYLSIIIMFIFPSIWVWSLLGSPSSLEEVGNRMSELSILMWVFALLPMPLIFIAFRHLFHAIVGLIYEIDERKREIFRNGKLIARFAEIERVHVSRETSQQRQDTYGLELYIKGRHRPLSIDKSTDAEIVIQAADSIEAMIGKDQPDFQPESTTRQQLASSSRQVLQRPPLAFFIAFTVMGLAAMGGGIYMFTDTLDFINSCREVSGTVVENIAKRDSEGDLTYTPKVQFVTLEEDRTLVFESNFSSSPPSYRPGDSVVVLYQEDDPTDARIKSFSSLWLFPVVLCVVGVVCLSISLFASRMKKDTTLIRPMPKHS